MIISKTDYGTFIFGRIVKLKLGSGSACETLTIVTLEDINTAKRIKMLCWDDMYQNKNLSDYVRRKKCGDLIAARVVFDIGDSRKCVAKEIKEQGCFSSIYMKQNIYAICGNVNSVYEEDQCFSVLIKVPDNTWYLVSWWRSSAVKAKEKIHAGDTVCISCSNMIYKVNNGFKYRSLTGAYFENCVR